MMNIPYYDWYKIKDPPAAPSGVMTTYDQFTKTGASISVTWSTSSGADNYTIKVTPPMSNFTTTATSLQLIIVYNVNYSVNITAQNCAGSNSTIVSLIVGEAMAYSYMLLYHV